MKWNNLYSFPLFWLFCQTQYVFEKQTQSDAQRNRELLEKDCRNSNRAPCFEISKLSRIDFILVTETLKFVSKFYVEHTPSMF